MLKYDKAWAALNLLIRQGRGFSGHERNCCFLNLGTDSPRYANVSSASGLDFDDDGRGVALCDWDGDGDLDLWLSNRTGPAVRFVRNDATNGRHWIAFRLEGRKVNRDAIGARIDLYAGAQGQTRRIKSLRAGHGHLSQNSKWLHFGLGGETRIDRAVVHWPGGDREEFRGLATDRRFLLVEGNGRAEPIKARPSLKPFASIQPRSASVSGGGRIVLLRPAPMPVLDYRALDGGKSLGLFTISKSAVHPTLLNLWATWCAPCLEEMAQWSRQKKAFEEAGLRVISLCVDEPSEHSGVDATKIKNVLKRLDYRFEVGIPHKDALGKLDAFQRAFVGPQSPLPAPSSVLVDGRGRAAVIYRGPVSVEQVIEDLALLEAPAEKVLAAAIPFRGQWIGIPKVTEPRKIALKLLEGGDLPGAKDYIEHLLQYRETHPNLITDADAYAVRNLLGAIFYDEKHHDEALRIWKPLVQANPADRALQLDISRAHAARREIKEAAMHLREALRLNQNDSEHLAQLGRFVAELGERGEAITLFRESLAVDPSDMRVRFELAEALYHDGKVAEAAAELSTILASRPDWPPACNNLAWIRATAHDPNLRDASEAVRLAEVSANAAKNELPFPLGTLAASYARAGEFEEAIAAARKAIDIAEKNKDAMAAADLRAKLALYQQRQPFTEVVK